MADPSLLTLVHDWGPIVAGVAAAALPWLKIWKDAQRDRNDLVKLAHDIAADWLERLQERVEALEAEIKALKTDHAAQLATKDARIQLLEGEKHQLEAVAHAYAELLRRHDIPHPVRSSIYWASDPATGALTVAVNIHEPEGGKPS